MTIAEKLCQNLGLKNLNKSKSGALLFFHKNYSAEKFRDLFDITYEKEAFDEAFQIVTNGKGNELTKINSVISSSLLSLLCFYPLFKNPRNKVISFNFEENEPPLHFNKTFFEIRNKVINGPSCIDVVLQSEDKSKLLFLESKFCEYSLYKSKKEEYGPTYYEKLYKDNPLCSILKENGISCTKDEKMLLESKEMKYIDGIKQNISHIIGIIRGPQEGTDTFYTQEYLESYKKAYEDASELIYGTILFDPCDMDDEDTKNDFNKYKDLYIKIIGNNSLEILKQVKESTIIKEENTKNITILRRPLTYQQLFKENHNYSNILSDKIKKFYNL